jgi:hypothetical protein
MPRTETQFQVQQQKLECEIPNRYGRVEPVKCYRNKILYKTKLVLLIYVYSFLNITCIERVRQLIISGKASSVSAVSKKILQ